MANRLMSALTGIGRAIADTYRFGGRTLIAAPLIVAMAVVPEFVQHAYEITQGMFNSLGVFRLLANDPTRWIFGYFKVAGLVLAMLLTVRFWGVGGSMRRTFAIPPLALGKVVLAVLAMLAVGEAFGWPGKHGAPAAAATALTLFSAVIQCGFSVLIVALLVEDEISLREAFVDRLPTALLMLVTLAVAFGPAQLLHGANHKLAMGQPAVLVWLLMIWDSLVVGLLATLVGSALWVAYRTGASWRGWGDHENAAERVPVV